MVKKEYGQGARKTAHFNVIDALIIVLLIAVVLGIYFRFNIIDKLTQNDNLGSYAVSFSVENIRHTTPTYMNIGDEVYFGDTDEPFGVLISESDNNTALNITPSSKIFVDSSGNVVEVYYSGEEARINAKGRIECKGVYTDEGGFCVDGTRYIAPGQSLEIKTELVTVTVTVTSIDEIVAEE